VGSILKLLLRTAKQAICTVPCLSFLTIQTYFDIEILHHEKQSRALDLFQNLGSSVGMPSRILIALQKYPVFQLTYVDTDLVMVE
jgi:hypothetical protein